MNAAKVAISLHPRLLRQVDSLVRMRTFRSRSEVFQSAISEKLMRLDRTRLARECAKLSPNAEQRLADEGLRSDAASWPEY